MLECGGERRERQCANSVMIRKSLVIGYTDRVATNWTWGKNVTSLIQGLDRVYERKEPWEFSIRRIDSRK